LEKGNQQKAARKNVGEIDYRGGASTAHKVLRNDPQSFFYPSVGMVDLKMYYCQKEWPE